MATAAPLAARARAVAMPTPYVPVPEWLTGWDVFSLVTVPLGWVGSLLYRLIRRPPIPPRAVFEISADRFKLTMVDRGTGEVPLDRCRRTNSHEYRTRRVNAQLQSHPSDRAGEPVRTVDAIHRRDEGDALGGYLVRTR